MASTPDLETIRNTVEGLLAAEAARSEAIKSELDTVGRGRDSPFERTREIINDEREMLVELDELLAVERTRINDLEAATAHLQVEQAVRNRDASLEKLERHNEFLQEFHDALMAGLEAVSANLDRLEHPDVVELEDDADPHLRNARDALEAHNETVDELGRHLRILTQYML